MSGICAICEQVASDSGADVITCYGPCKKAFHGKCVNLSNAVLKTIANNNNISWNCDDCNKPTNVPGDLTEISKSLVALTEAVASNSKVLATLVANSIAPKSFTSVVAGQAGVFPSPSAANKRRRTDDTFVGSPVSRKTVVGSGTDVSIEIKSVEARKDVVASQLHTSTTEEELCAYLNDVHKLSTPNAMRCRMLLPNGKKVEDLDWISFKISVPESMYEKVMVAGNWPKGVTVRDFERRSRVRSAGAFLSKAIPSV